MPITTTPSGGPQGEFSTYTPIYATTVTSGNPTSITLSNIPTTYTDLILVASFAGNYPSNDRSQLVIQVGSGSVDTGTNYSVTSMTGNGTTATSGRSTSANWFSLATFPLGPSSSLQKNDLIVHFQNYSNTTTNKTILGRATQMNSDNNTPATVVEVGLWRSTSPITTIKIKDLTDLYYFYSGSTFTLYGIKAAAPAPKATGGDLVYTDNTYWYHVFNNSGVLDVKTSMNVDYLVVAGGGGAQLGGGGAGGLRSTVTATGGSGSLESQLSLVPIQYPIIVGAGGVSGSSGSNSTFSTITSTGGGAGQSAANGFAGGSGGGGGTGAEAATRTGGAASPSGQGFAGGGTSGGKNRASGGGGGAGAAGGDAQADQGGGPGAAGRNVAITGTSVGYAGGGGGGGRSSFVNGSGTSFGGGSGGTYTGGAEVCTNGTANRGGGGGGGWEQNRSGGSGIVVVRYPV